MAEQQASSSVSANKIGDHIFNDINETNITIKKSIIKISNKPSRCLAEWVDADLVPFICSTLNPVLQNNQQNKIRYTFYISNCNEIFHILVFEKRIRIPADHVISSSKELGKCAYCKWHDSFPNTTCDCNVFCRQLQLAIDECWLMFRDHLNTGWQASHSQILPKGVINLEGKKINVRPSQAETTKGKIVIIGESREKVRPTTKKGNAHTKSR
jgi:hypothetical protein